jgi:Protein of unknown function (DUF3349)
MAATSTLRRIAAWLHAGYPEGVPPQDYFAVLALLAKHLSEQEVVDAADVLALSLPLPENPAERKKAIADAIRAVTDTPPVNSDLERVERQLAAWPLDAV